MKRILIAVACLSLSAALFGQRNRFTEAVKYNDFIVGQQSQIGKTIQAFNDACTNTSDTAVLHGKRRDIINQANQSYKQLQQTEPFKGDTSLIKHAMALFLFYAKTAANEYRQMLDVIFSKSGTGQQKNEQLQVLLDTVTTQEKLWDTNFLNAQSAFAKKYNIDLKPNEEKSSQ
ncbi:MAG: hypothetical protein U0V75_16275 [Ferruginibacter sp.]